MVDTKRYKDWLFMAEKDLKSKYPAEDPMSVTGEDVKECFRITETVMSKVIDEIGKTEG